MADSFQVSAQAAGLEHLDETGLAMLDNGRNGQPNIVDNRPRPSQASSSRGPSEQLTEANAGNAMNHDRADYWIFNASIMYVAAMILGRQIYQPEVKGKIKRKQRRLDKTPSNGNILRTLAFAYLVVGAEALAIQVREGRLPAERQFDDLEPPCDSFGSIPLCLPTIWCVESLWKAYHRQGTHRLRRTLTVYYRHL